MQKEREVSERTDVSEAEGLGFQQLAGIKLLLQNNMVAWPPGSSRSAVMQERAELGIWNHPSCRLLFRLGTKASAALFKYLTLLEEGLQKPSPAGIKGAFSGMCVSSYVRFLGKKKKKISWTLLWRPELMVFVHLTSGHFGLFNSWSALALPRWLLSLLVILDTFGGCSISAEGLTETVCVGLCLSGSLLSEGLGSLMALTHSHRDSARL